MTNTKKIQPVTTNASGFVTVWTRDSKVNHEVTARIATQLTRGVKPATLQVDLIAAVDAAIVADKLAYSKKHGVPVAQAITRIRPLTVSTIKAHSRHVSYLVSAGQVPTDLDLIAAISPVSGNSAHSAKDLREAFGKKMTTGAFIAKCVEMTEAGKVANRAKTPNAKRPTQSSVRPSNSGVEAAIDETDGVSVVEQAQELIDALAKVYGIASDEDKSLILGMTAAALNANATHVA